jgi:hypothetical protein
MASFDTLTSIDTPVDNDDERMNDKYKNDKRIIRIIINLLS